MSTVFATVSTPGPPGPTGPPGYSPQFIVAAGAPSNSVGNNGDMYINSTTGDVYGPKTAGVWGPIACNIKGATGATGPAGYSPQYIVAPGPPSAAVGNNGDMYINSTTSDVYGPKTAGSWGLIVCNIKGATGATGPQGPPGVGYTPRGAWVSTTTYAQGDQVTDGNILYISLQAGNLGHTPASSPTWWEPVGSGVSQTPWLSDIDGAGFKLKNAGNVGIGNSLAVLPNPGATDIRLVLGSTAASSPLAEINLIGNAGGAGLGLSSISAANYAITVADKRVAAINMGMEGTIDSGWIALYTWNAGAAAERMRITAAGNVGIGTTSPSTQLDVKSTTGACAITVETTTGTFAYTQYSVDSHAYQISVGGSVSGQNQNLYIYDVTRSAVAFLITGTGNVGIGTTNPVSGKLTVADVSRDASTSASSGAGGFTLSSQTGAATDDNLIMGVHTGDYSWIQAVKAGSTVRILSLQPIGGNIGIGTTIPGAPLHVTGASGPDVPSGGVIFSRYWPNNADTRAAAIFEYYQTGSATDRLAFAVSQTSTPYDIAKVQMVLTQYGNVGIGTTNPGGRLEVFGAGGTPGTGANILRLSRSGGTNILDCGSYTTSPFGMWMQAYDSSGAPTYPLCLQPTGGRVGIVNPNPAYPLDVAGDVNCTGMYRVNGVAISTGGITAKSIPSRALGTVYQNTTGKWMFVSVTSSINANGFVQLAAHSDNPPSLLICSMSNGSGVAATYSVSGWVGPGEFYRANPGGGGATETGWVEWT